jgi:hypothetical protein
MTQDPSEECIVRQMVRVLWEHRLEWVSFRRLSRLIGISDHNADSLAGFAEYRGDLFAIAKDKRLKLQQRIVEEIDKKGIESWNIPARPQQVKHGGRGEESFAIEDIQSGPCYCHSPHRSILNDLKSGSVPGDALICTSCWREICRVRGLHLNSIDPEMWEEICRRRGYILRRQNPRGF